MKKCLVMNIKYGWYSKRILWIVLFTLVLLMGIQVINYSEVKDTFDGYNKKIEFYKDDPKGMEEEFSSGYTISMSEDGKSGVIENPLPYYKEQLNQYIYTASPVNALAQMQEASVIIFPIIFGIFGAICSTVDSKYKMNKIKKIKYSKNTYFVAKHLAMYLEYIIIVIVAFILGKLSNFIIYERIKKMIPVNDFQEYAPVKCNMQTHIYRWILILVVGLVFMEIGAGIAVLVKHSIVAIIAVFLYLYIVPVLGKWDLKNVMYYSYKKLFDLKGVINVQSACQGTNSFISVCSIFIVFLASLILGYVFEIKRSSYEI